MSELIIAVGLFTLIVLMMVTLIMDYVRQGKTIAQR
jgi:hypothetical protein